MQAFLQVIKRFRFPRWIRLLPLFGGMACVFSFCDIPPNYKDSCNRLRVTYLSGIANGPAKVIWEGGEGWEKFNVYLGGYYPGSPSINLGAGEASQGSYSATFPIDSVQAQKIVDNNGTFTVVLLVQGVPDYVGEICSSTFLLNVSEMTGVQKATAVPTIASQPPINNPENTPKPPEPITTEEATGTPEVTGTEPVTGP